MLHFSCDLCGKQLDPEAGPRYVVRMEVFAADDPTAAHRLAQAGVEDERTPVGHAGFNDYVGLNAEDHLLDANHVLGQLHDRPTQPREAV